MLSVLRKELEYKVGKLKYKKVEGHATEDQNFQLVNKPARIGSIHTKFFSLDWFIKSIMIIY